MTYLVEIPEESYIAESKDAESLETYWLGKVEYTDGVVKYFRFREAYAVKVSDFYDPVRTIKTITLS